MPEASRHIEALFETSLTANAQRSAFSVSAITIGVAAIRRRPACPHHYLPITSKIWSQPIRIRGDSCHLKPLTSARKSSAALRGLADIRFRLLPFAEQFDRLRENARRWQQQKHGDPK
jgi:hypothetical protein